MLIFSIYTLQNHLQHYPPNEQCVRFPPFFACFPTTLYFSHYRQLVAKFKKLRIFDIEFLFRLFENFFQIFVTLEKLEYKNTIYEA